MQQGDNNMVDEEDGLYSEEGREELMEEEDEITNVDEAFMEGYEEAEKVAECAMCKKMLDRNMIEEEMNGTVYRFCSSKCASQFEEKNQ